MAKKKINLEKILNILANFLKRLHPKSATANKNDTLPVEKPMDIVVESKIKKEESKEKKSLPESLNKKFLSCPIQGYDENGKPFNSRTVKISSILDHFGTAIDSNSKNWWGKHAKDQKVKAFNGEIGDAESSAKIPYGYTKKTPTPFFLAKEINYVGASSSSDKYGPTYYLNYDGHAGYDFPYPKMTPVIAPADGKLCKSNHGEDSIYGANWSSDHSFYIKHDNGYITWFRHCEKLRDDIEIQILNDFMKECFVKKSEIVAYVGKFGTLSMHLHFEVRNDKNIIVDPYVDELWEV